MDALDVDARCALRVLHTAKVPISNVNFDDVLKFRDVFFFINFLFYLNERI